MEADSSSKAILTDYNQRVESLMNTMLAIKQQPIELKTPQDLEALESTLHQTTRELADTITGIKLQQQLDNALHQKTAKLLMKSQPKQIKNMGKRVVTLRLLGGTKLMFCVDYYHRPCQSKKGKGSGCYPQLLLLGIAKQHTPGLESLISLMAAAASSYHEAGDLIKQLLGFSIGVKTIRCVVKRFATQARTAMQLESLSIEEDQSLLGKRVAASVDGGRIRLRKNKRGRKTKKGRNRYHSDWREPKLLIIYIMDENGKKSRSVFPIMDATLNGPDEIFSLLIFYLQQWKIDAADLLLFLSDGAKWIWDRAKKLAASLKIPSDRCLFVLDYYHAVEHLSDLAKAKRWTASVRDKWVKQQKRRLLKGQLELFTKALKKACYGCKSTIVKREWRYFRTHLPHMAYGDLKGNGLPIGSGAVESGIRRVINLRLKGAGIFWHEDVAEAMLLLRSYYKAGRWNLLKNMAFKGVLLNG